jgi:sulfate-transporting ATPase
VTGIHLGLTPESTFVARRDELRSLSSMVPLAEDLVDMTPTDTRVPRRLPPLAEDEHGPARPRKRRRRIDPSAPASSAGGTGSEGDLPAPQIKSRRHREVVRRRYQPPPEEQTDWDPAPPAAMEAQARKGRRPPAAPQAVPPSSARRAEKIFEAAIAAYVRGDLESAATDAMLARVFDPTHDGYARAELDWNDELFYPGAKIGVLGPTAPASRPAQDHGRPRRRLLRRGAWAPRVSASATCRRSRSSTPRKDVKGNVMDGVAEARPHRRAYNEVWPSGPTPTPTTTSSARSRASSRTRSRPADAWNLDRNVEIAMDALRCPPDDADVTVLSGGERAAWRCAGCCSRSPTCCCSTSPPTTSTPSRSPGSSASSSDYPGTVVAITHDRYFLDNVAKWILELDRGRGIPFEGNYSSWLEQKQERLASEEKQQLRAQRRRSSASSSGCAWRRRPARPRARPASPPTRSSPSEASRSAASKLEIAIPPGPRLGDQVIIADGLTQGLRRQAADRGPVVLAAAGRHRRHHRPQRRRQDDAVQDDRRPRAARRRLDEIGDTVDLLRRPGAATTSTRQDRLRGDHRRRRVLESAAARSTAGPTCRASTSRAPTSRSSSATSPAASATGVHLAKLLQVRRQRAAARRAHQRPRRRHAAGARGGRCSSLPRLRGGDLSHDRWFLDRIATHILAFEGDSQVRWFEGNFPTTRWIGRSASVMRGPSG